MLLGEVKIATLKLCYDNWDRSIGINDLSTLIYENNIRTKLYNINESINRCLQYMAVRGKLHNKEYEFTQATIPNLLPDTGTVTHYDTDILHVAERGKSYYFETRAPAIVHIEILIDGVWVEKKLILTGGYTYKPHKGLIDNPTNANARIRFSGSTVYDIRNVAIFGYSFATDDECPIYSSVKNGLVRYNLTGMISDFDKFVDITYEGVSFKSTLKVEDGKTLVLPSIDKTPYTIIYYPKPQKITNYELNGATVLSTETSNYTELDISDKLAVLIPYWCKAELYDEEEPEKATEARTKFELGLSSIGDDVIPQVEALYSWR
jgi:hypothetical protein